jgi:hypothetical protein
MIELRFATAGKSGSDDRTGEIYSRDTESEKCEFWIVSSVGSRMKKSADDADTRGRNEERQKND